jgi:hypothetical protein
MPGIPSGKKQLALAGLDSLGSNDRGDSLELSETAKALVDIAYCVVSTAQDNLDKDGSVATAELESSIQAENIKIDGTSLSVDIVLLDRYKFINDGVKGTESGKGKYQFKSKRPSLKMVDSIKRWMKVRGIRNTKYKPISKTEEKDKEIAALEGMAWGIATNVKKHGIKPTKFFTKALKGCTDNLPDVIAKGYKLDIINSLK